jgi:hypothetical protein
MVFHFTHLPPLPRSLLLSDPDQASGKRSP